jgi:hypothetical protein
MGSALGISEVGGLIEISTHINPSAGCVLVLRRDLSFVAELFGWVVGTIDGNLILEENTIHFAPTHPLRLDVFDLQKRTLASVYPAARDAAREAFTAQLRQHLPSAQWCSDQNNACDPEVFSADLAHLTVDEAGRSFSFDVVMDAEGFGDDKETPAISPMTAHYVCSLTNGRWVLTSN